MDGMASYYYFLVWKDAVSIQGWLPFQVRVYARLYCPHTKNMVSPGKQTKHYTTRLVSLRSHEWRIWLHHRAQVGKRSGYDMAMDLNGVTNAAISKWLMHHFVLLTCGKPVLVLRVSKSR